MPDDPDPQEQARQIVFFLVGALSVSAGVSPRLTRSIMDRAFEQFGVSAETITPEEALRVVPSICEALETFAPPEQIERLRELQNDLEALGKRGSGRSTGGGGEGSDGGEPGSAAAVVYAHVTPKKGPRQAPPKSN